MSSNSIDNKISEIEFRSNGELTIGAEVELQIIDKKSLKLTPRYKDILKNTSFIKAIKPEMYANTIEINSKKCNITQEIEQDLLDHFNVINNVGNSLGIDFSSTASHPFSAYNDGCPIVPTERYQKLIKNCRWVTKMTNVYGLHIHLGMKNGEESIKFNNFFLYFLPHLLSLSTSAPFWDGVDTAMASCRLMTYETMPMSGLPHPVENWRDFEELCHHLINCNSITCIKDLWWDIRPSPSFGTLEIRVCDGLATLSETAAIIAYTHLLAHWFRDNQNNKDVPTFKASDWMVKENKWRVMKDGLDTQLIINNQGTTKAIRQDILDWLDKVSPYTQKLGYEKYITTLKSMMDKGNSSQRQKIIYKNTNSIEEVTKFNIDEFNNREPLWQVNHHNKTSSL